MNQFRAIYNQWPFRTWAWDAEQASTRDLAIKKTNSYTSKKLNVSFSFTTDCLGIIHYTYVHNRRGESHRSMANVIAKTLATNLMWNKLQSRFPGIIFSLKYNVGTDSPKQDFLIGPRIYVQLRKYLAIEKNNDIYINKYGIRFDLSKWSIKISQDLPHLHIMYIHAVGRKYRVKDFGALLESLYHSEDRARLFNSLDIIDDKDKTPYKLYDKYHEYFNNEKFINDTKKFIIKPFFRAHKSSIQIAEKLIKNMSKHKIYQYSVRFIRQIIMECSPHFYGMYLNFKFDFEFDFEFDFKFEY